MGVYRLDGGRRIGLEGAGGTVDELDGDARKRGAGKLITSVGLILSPSLLLFCLLLLYYRL